MVRHRVGVLVALAAILLGGCNGDDSPTANAPVLVPTPAPIPTVASSNAVILEWNRILTQNQGAGTLYSFRQYAMLHIAMFDAVNSVTRQYTPYRIEVSNSSSASEEAAAAQAARDVMVSQFPAATASFDAALAARLATLPAAAAATGVEVGKLAAAAVVQWRTNDGAAGPDPAYTPPALPGLWQPTASGQVAAGTRIPNIIPFALVSPTQFLPAPYPPLNSAEYADSFQEVASLGRVDSVMRTADQTLVARLIAGVNYTPGPFALWNAIARDLAESRRLSLIETARLFALMNAAMHDGLQTSHTSKYIYQLWRPITAITRAGEDNNDATIADLTWTPLITTPPYPSHASNVQCIGTSASRELARVLGTDQIPISVTWTWTGAAGAGTNVTRQYSSLSALAEEAGMARVWGGIHFKFELTAAAASCTKVADYVFTNYLKLR